VTTSTPKISIIVPVYNVEEYLGRCVDSILSQTFTDFECILVDDGSPDKCPVICDEYAKKDERITVIHKKNGGVSSARNAGLDVARGEWIGFVDSDDWCDTDMFSVLYENALRYNADVSICDFKKVRCCCTIENRTTKKEPKVYNKYEAKIRLFSTHTFWGTSCCKLVKHSLISQNNIQYEKAIKYKEDTLFFFEIFNFADKVVYVPVHYYNYFSNPRSVTKQCGLTDAAKTAFVAYDRMIFMEYDIKIKNRIILNKILFALLLCNQHIKSGDYKSDDFYFIINIFSQYKYIIIYSFSITIYKKIKIILLLLSPYLYYCLSKTWRRLPFRRNMEIA